MPVDPAWINADAGTPAYDAAELRRLDAVLLTQGVADRFGARSGVHPGGSNAVSISGMTVTILDLKAVVYPTGNSQRGPYRVALPSKTHAVPTADPSLPRKDIVQLRVRDHDEDASGLRQADTEYKTGVPDASPAEPSVDTDAFKMALIDVPAGSTTPTLTYQAPFTVAAGGILPIRTLSEYPPSGLYEGFYSDKADSDTLERWSGTGRQVMALANPWTSSNQVSNPPFDVTGTLTAFTGSAWPAFTFTVPPSGAVKIILSARLGNTNTAASTCRLAFALSGGHTLAASLARSLTATGGQTEYNMSRVVPVTGMTAGNSVTLTPYWYISSGTSSTAQLQDGNIFVERLV